MSSPCQVDAILDALAAHQEEPPPEGSDDEAGLAIAELAGAAAEGDREDEVPELAGAEPGVAELAAADEVPGPEPAAPPPPDPLVELRSGVFGNQAGLQVGLIHCIGPGQKATCKVHADCVCWVSRQADPQELGSALKGWLRELTSAEPPTAAQHRVSAYHLKVKFGMRPRKPPGV
jgi:hypothetical protein